MSTQIEARRLSGEQTWAAVSCRTADLIREHRLVKPYGGRSDLDGQWGEPCVYTEWGLDLDAEEVVLREWRYPSRFAGEPDVKPCRHEVPTTTPTPKETP